MINSAVSVSASCLLLFDQPFLEQPFLDCLLFAFQSYIFGDASEDQLFVAVDRNVSTSLYISDVSGLVYSESLERILYYNKDYNPALPVRSVLFTIRDSFTENSFSWQRNFSLLMKKLRSSSSAKQWYR